MSEPPATVTVLAPAKVNLGLRVLGRRPDGFHDIETLFVAVSLFDELKFERRASGGLSFTWEKSRAEQDRNELGSDDDNLIVRAVRVLERECGTRFHLMIRLRKAIPIAAGLGGGSADCAATLLALTQLYPENLSQIDLKLIAAELGSDIPFFLGPPAAIGRGRGEVLTPVAIDLTWYAILICPRIASPTPKVYAALDLTCLPRMSHFPARLEGEGFFAALALIHNDLQDVVVRQIPEVLHWQKRLLTLGAEGAYVSGSGPTVFGIYRHKPDLAAVEAIRAEGVDVFVVRPLDTKMTMVIG